MPNYERGSRLIHVGIHMSGLGPMYCHQIYSEGDEGGGDA